MSKKEIKKFIPAKNWLRKKFNEKNPGFNGIQLRARKIRAEKMAETCNLGK